MRYKWRSVNNLYCRGYSTSAIMLSWLWSLNQWLMKMISSNLQATSKWVLKECCTTMKREPQALELNHLNCERINYSTETKAHLKNLPLRRGEVRKRTRKEEQEKRSCEQAKLHFRERGSRKCIMFTHINRGISPPPHSVGKQNRAAPLATHQCPIAGSSSRC